MVTYNPDLPVGCPPAAAKPVEGSIYRAISNSAPSNKDLWSHRELGLPCAMAECICWGTSVWVELADVAHALRTYKFLRKKKFVKIEVTADHGVILHTPTGQQPSHRTFWRDSKIDFVPLSEIVDPLAGVI